LLFQRTPDLRFLPRALSTWAVRGFFPAIRLPRISLKSGTVEPPLFYLQLEFVKQHSLAAIHPVGFVHHGEVWFLHEASGQVSFGNHYLR
jgi:hypothetical protein